MSSPSLFRDHASPDAVSAPADSPEEAMDSEIPRRLMRVKVLYSFDDQNKTNCLARLPNPQNIPTVDLDEGTQIGVIELKRCIQAIVSASPELITKLEQDYTVYAYDFSEYETPLVGQGMLSWVLASASPTPSAPASQSRTMITGRVCKNILGIFSNGIKETLEVKLKLVPVPSCSQSKYLESMEAYHNLSRLMPEGFDPNAWSEFLEANPGIGLLAGQATARPTTGGNRGSTGGNEFINQMLYHVRDDGDLSMSQIGSVQGSVQGSRAGSPTPSMRSCAALQQITQDDFTRPSSRTSVRSLRPLMPRPSSISEGDMSAQAHQDGAGKKRARVTKTNFRGRPSFGANNESLRVAASTAASIRVYRPVAINPTAQDIAGNEQQPRAPTPRPDRRIMPQVQGRPSRVSSLRHQASAEETGEYISPYGRSQAEQSYSTNVFAEDEERQSAFGTPSPEFPSSPPEFDSNSMPPSSPALPSLPYPDDSGFMSECGLDLDEEAEPNRATKRGNAKRQPSKRQDSTDAWVSEVPGDSSLLPTKLLPRPIHYRKAETMNKQAAAAAAAAAAWSVPGNSEHSAPVSPRTQPVQPNLAVPPLAYPEFPLSASESALSGHAMAANNQGATQSTLMPPPSAAPNQSGSGAAGWSQSPPAMDSQQSTNIASGALAARSSSVPVQQPRQLLRSQTWAGDLDSQLHSDGLLEPHSDLPFDGEPRSGSGARRKKSIRKRLESSLAAGEMPRFCQLCGEIDTCTWRKAFTKLVDGSPDNIELSKTRGGVVGYEIEKRDEGGKVTQYRIYKKSLAVTEQGKEDMEKILLCNACGLYFDKNGTMRPPQFWGKNNEGKKKGGKRKKNDEDDQTCPPSDVHTDAVTAFDGAQDVAQDQHDQPSPAKRPRIVGPSLSDDVTMSKNSGSNTELDNALRRAIQSSPARFLGSQESPIDLEADLTPKPTRRLLFPSPRKEGEVKSLGDEPNQKPGQRPERAKGSVPSGLDLDDGAQTDKENRPPSADEDDGLAHLFEDVAPTSAQYGTPKSSGRSLLDLLKTPTSKSRRSATTPKSRSSGTRSIVAAGLETPTHSTRTGLFAQATTPFGAGLNALFTDSLLTSPPTNFDFSQLATFDTPGKRSINFNFDDVNMKADDFFGTDGPMPSSPPNFFSVFEDPENSSAGVFGGSSVFDGSDAMQGLQSEGEEYGAGSLVVESATVDITSIVENVEAGV